ncbi:hypothetical protein H7F51_11715 [Novosphingobium flavum]|uniref:Uncharacterized protein n=1 Tax=Novosphingobium flavum TaxID=1778672 RepID=A0A7X1FSI4_9SPHN|nr:hypothetical protein [Novosphingobium flavum]MBC2666184.1 hypothetical protein [Novosphingobium flavum]
MRTLTKIIAPALVAITALGSAGVASAQPYQGRDFRQETPARTEAIRSQLNQIEQRVNRNDNRDRISEREAAGLRREVREIRDQFRAFNRNGLDNREFRTLQVRIDRVKARLQVERHDRDGRRW